MTDSSASGSLLDGGRAVITAILYKDGGRAQDDRQSDSHAEEKDDSEDGSTDSMAFRENEVDRITMTLHSIFQTSSGEVNELAGAPRLIFCCSGVFDSFVNWIANGPDSKPIRQRARHSFIQESFTISTKALNKRLGF